MIPNCRQIHFLVWVEKKKKKKMMIPNLECNTCACANGNAYNPRDFTMVLLDSLLGCSGWFIGCFMLTTPN